MSVLPATTKPFQTGELVGQVGAVVEYVEQLLKKMPSIGIPVVTVGALAVPIPKPTTIIELAAAAKVDGVTFISATGKLLARNSLLAKAEPAPKYSRQEALFPEVVALLAADIDSAPLVLLVPVTDEYVQVFVPAALPTTEFRLTSPVPAVQVTAVNELPESPRQRSLLAVVLTAV